MRPLILLLTLCLMAVACARAQPTPTPTSSPRATATPAVTPTWTPVSTPATAVVPTPTATPTPEAIPTDPIFSLVLERTVAIRGLEPLEEIAPLFMTREELASSLRHELEDEREEVLKSQALLRVLGLISQGDDLYQMLLDLYSEQVVGFYDTETRELYMVQDVEELTPSQEISLAHEYTHALQQQHFDIDAMSKAVEEDSEASAALDALIEGDATAVQLQYMTTYLTSSQLQEVYDASGDSEVFDASPYFLQQSLLYPYTEGLNFTRTLLLTGRWAAVDETYGSPPTSTEQVLHPEKYLRGEGPTAVALPDVAAALGGEWRETYTDVMGEFTLKTYLETLTGPEVAARAASGWNGDRFVLLEGPQGEHALTVLLAWDSSRNAQEFFDALDSSGAIPQEGYLGAQGDRVLWVLSPSGTLTGEIRAQFSGF